MTEPTNNNPSAPEIASPFTEALEIKHGYLLMPTEGVDEAATMKEINKLLESKDATGAELKEALIDLRELVKNQWTNQNYTDVFKRCRIQRLEGDKGFININTSRDVPTAGTYSGAAAVKLLKSSLGIGKRTTIPLWASGVVLSVGNFKESDMLRLQIRIAEERERLALRTRNLIYSADDVEISHILIDFILDHVIEHNVRDVSVDELRDLILVTDLQSLFAGALASIYPTGYPIVHACVNRPACDWTTVGDGSEKIEKLPHLDFRRVIFNDDQRLGLPERRHMEMPMQGVTKENVLDYQRRVSPKALSAPINDSGEVIYRLELEIPTLRKFTLEMSRWVADITDDIINSLDSNTPNRQKEQRVSSYEDMYRRRLFNQRNLCWVKAVKGNIVGVEGEDSEITFENRVPYPDDTTIIDVIADIANDATISNNILEVTEAFKKDAIVSMAGFPNFECPKCGSSQKHEEDNQPVLIPLNMANYFFDIMGSRQAVMMG